MPADTSSFLFLLLLPLYSGFPLRPSARTTQQVFSGPPVGAAVMGPSEGPRAPRGRACAGAWRAAVVLLLLGSAAAQTPAPSAPCGNGTAPPTLRQPGYRDSAGADPGAGFMAPLVQSFLDTVQPSPFPRGR